MGTGTSLGAAVAVNRRGLPNAAPDGARLVRVPFAFADRPTADRLPLCSLHKTGRPTRVEPSEAVGVCPASVCPRFRLGISIGDRHMRRRRDDLTYKLL